MFPSRPQRAIRFPASCLDWRSTLVGPTLNELPPGRAGPISLQPHTEISPHCGYTDLVYRCHLGLVVPENCAIRVGTETREWREGRTMFFEDSVEHSAWNRSDSVRVVLLLDFLKRPESEADMAAVLAISKEFDRRYNVIS